jgi:hypothetical protein
VRIARSVRSLAPVGIGDHVCWLVRPEDDFRRAARAYLGDADIAPGLRAKN